MQIRLVSALLVGAQIAAADPPAPSRLPELVARDRVGVSLTLGSSIAVSSATLGGSGTYALSRHVELFAAVPLQVATETFHRPDRDSVVSSSARAGARAIYDRGSFAISPSLWAWIPIATTGELGQHRRLPLDGTGDGRPLDAAAAIGTAVDAAWRSSASYLQLQLGAATVGDRGPQLENVFAAIAAGTNVSEVTSLHAEYKVAAYPDDTLHILGLSVVRGDAVTAWRVRLQPLIASGEGSAAMTLEFIHRIP